RRADARVDAAAQRLDPDPDLAELLDVARWVAGVDGQRLELDVYEVPEAEERPAVAELELDGEPEDEPDAELVRIDQEREPRLRGHELRQQRPGAVEGESLADLEPILLGLRAEPLQADRVAQADLEVLRDPERGVEDLGQRGIAGVGHERDVEADL